MASTTRIAKVVTALCYDAQDYDLLNSSILVLTKKHGQLKAVVKSLVEQAQEWLDEIKTRKGIPTWLQLVETLRTVTEGKVGLSAPEVLS
jgi:26S proteasome regulatory subunit N5